MKVSHIPIKIGNGASFVRFAFTKTRAPLKVTRALMMSDTVAAPISTPRGIEHWALNRRNVLIADALMNLDASHGVSLVNVQGDTFTLQVGDGENLKVMRDVARLLTHLLERRVVVLEGGRGAEVTLRLEPLGIRLSGGVNEVVWACNELSSAIYDHMFDVNDKVVVDIGGYIGDTALYFAAKGAKRVHAFEPSPRLNAMARKNIASEPRITWHEYGLASSDRTCRLVNNMAVENGPSGEGERIQLKNVNEVLADVLRVEGSIDMLKIDCEGGEYELLPAMDKVLLREVQYVCMEIHAGDHDTLCTLLNDAGFQIDAIHPLPGEESGGVYYFSQHASIGALQELSVG